MFKKTKGSTVKKIYYKADENFVEVHVPKAPPKSEIQGYELSKKNQKWARTELPKNWYKDCAKEESRQIQDSDYVDPVLEDFRDQEWDRRDNGHWFMNNGKKIYVTGEHYFYMNWWKCDFGYPDFRVPDLELYYFLQYCVEDPCSMGINEITLRRDGKTARALAFDYQGVSKTLNVNGGIQSKTGSDAQKIFSKSLILPWGNLPNFFRPIYDYNSTQKKELNFFPPGAKGKAALEKFREDPDNEANRGLESTLDFKPSGVFAYDGYKFFRFVHDEAGKFEEGDVWARHEVLMPCFEQWGKVGAPYFGKMYCTTTVEDMSKIGTGFKKLTEYSDITIKDDNGRTTSGLYTYFKPAYKGYAYDDYGNALEKEGKKFFMNRRRALKDDPASLSSHIRKHPFTLSEAFMVDGDQCVFNAMVLNERRGFLDFNPNVTNRIDFVWKDGKKDGKVIAVPNSVNGKFDISYLFENDEDSNKIKQTRSFINDKGETTKQFVPLNDNKFASGSDPVDHGVVVDYNRKSAAAGYIFRKFDLLVDTDPNKIDEYGRPDWKTYKFVCEYINRLPDPEIYWEDMLMQCVYYGCQILIENQKQGIIGHFERRGYGAFIMNRPKNTHTQKGNAQDTPGIPASRQVINQYVEKWITYVNTHGHRIDFRNLVEDLLIFDPIHPRKHDATVAGGFTLIASDKAMPKKFAAPEVMSYVREYDNTGIRSKELKN